MVEISPEKNGYWPETKAENKFSVSYPGDVSHLNHQPPLPRFTDPAYIRLQQIAAEHEYTPPQKYSKIIPQSEYTPDILGELIQRWDGEGRIQEVLYYDENDNQLFFNTTSHENMAARLRVRHVIRRLKYYRTEPQGDITIIHRNETVAEIHTYVSEVNNKLTEFATSANSEPQLQAVGTTQEELEAHLWFINRFLTLSTEARKLQAKTEAHLSEDDPGETQYSDYSDAVSDLFAKAKEALENKTASSKSS